MPTPALLALADGSTFLGTAFGHPGQAVGEVVFNTAMTGYQEILTDPSYAQQIVTLTYPHIGNVGINSEDEESDGVYAAGLIIKSLSPIVSNWRSTESLDNYLKKYRVLGIANIDTRKLTRILRDKGAQNGCITTQVGDVAAAIQAARLSPSLDGAELASHVSTQEPYSWPKEPNNGKYHVVVIDYGTKRNILNLLVKRDCRLTVVPAKMKVQDLLALQPDGIVLSNGPGDPAACDYAISTARQLFEHNIPLFGICLGCQLIALASGAHTTKMKFGHHGANHPVQDLTSHAVSITSQNHGFEIDESSLPDSFAVTHRSLFDASLQGIRHKQKPIFGFQGHPEASPGPHDIIGLFDQFVNACKLYQEQL